MLGVFGVILTGLPDILDGSVARQSGRAGPRGAFFDSVCDRVADAALFIGVAWYLAETEDAAAMPVLAMAVLALSMLITYERARAESLGFQARGGLMERAERMVLLGVGLAFDILVPVLWMMLVLTAFTAVQRFVKVWRQATPERPRRTRHHRGSGTEEPRAGSLAQWWAAHRPQTERAAASRLRVASSLTARTRPRCRSSRSARRTSRTAPAPRSRALVPAPHRRAGWPRGVAQLGDRVHAGRRAPGGAQPAARPRAGRSAAPRCGATVAATFDSYGRYFYELFRLPDATPEWIDEHFALHRRRAHRGRRRRRDGARCSRCRTSATGTSPARGSRGRGYTVTVVAEPVEPPELFEWFVETRARLGMRVIPLVAVGRHRGAPGACAPTRSCASSPTATSPATASAVEFFGERTTLPGGPAMLALARRRAAAPGRVLLPRPRRGT